MILETVSNWNNIINYVVHVIIITISPALSSFVIFLVNLIFFLVILHKYLMEDNLLNI